MSNINERQCYYNISTGTTENLPAVEGLTFDEQIAKYDAEVVYTLASLNKGEEKEVTNEQIANWVKIARGLLPIRWTNIVYDIAFASKMLSNPDMYLFVYILPGHGAHDPVEMPDGEQSHPTEFPSEAMNHLFASTSYLTFYARNGKVWLGTLFHLAPLIDTVVKYDPDYEFPVWKGDERNA